MLNGRLDLHDCVDVERLAASILDRYVRRTRAVLQPADREDALAYLVASAWELSLRYEPARDRSPSFAGYLTAILAVRLVDWQRARLGRTRWTFSNHRRSTGRKPQNLERERPTLVSLDAPAGPGDHPLGELVAGGGGDPQEGGGAACGGLLEPGGRTLARDTALIRALAS